MCADGSEKRAPTFAGALWLPNGHGGRSAPGGRSSELSVAQASALRKRTARRKDANAKRAFSVQSRVGQKKERAPILIGALWLPNEDLNPDKQSQSLSCCRYTIGQYLKCLIIIAALHQNVNRVFKFFLIFQKAIDKSRENAL